MKSSNLTFLGPWMHTHKMLFPHGLGLFCFFILSHRFHLGESCKPGQGGSFPWVWKGCVACCPTPQVVSTVYQGPQECQHPCWEDSWATPVVHIRTKLNQGTGCHGKFPGNTSPNETRIKAARGPCRLLPARGHVLAHDITEHGARP